MIKRDLPNVLTCSRIIGVACLFWFIPFQNERVQLWTIFIYIVISFTDQLDGWLARKFNMVSDLGKILDPLADKILILLFLPLLSMNVITSFPVFIILAREFSMMGLRVIAAKQNLIIPASPAGKLKTVFTLVLIVLLMAKPQFDIMDLSIMWAPLQLIVRWVAIWPQFVFDGLIWTTVFLTVWSFLEYLFHFLWKRQLKLQKGSVRRARLVFLAYIPNSISFLNLLMGILSIRASILGDPAMGAVYILIGGVMDGLDGFFARKLHTHSKFGELIDTRADHITFGIAAAFLVFGFAQQIPFLNYFIVSFSLGGLYYGGVYYRLARFSQSSHSSMFEGLACTVAAAVMCIMVLSTYLSHPIVLFGMSVVLGGLMVSRIGYPHLSNRQFLNTYSLLKYPAFILLFLTIIKHSFSIKIHYLYFEEILFCMLLSYLIYPIFCKLKK